MNSDMTVPDHFDDDLQNYYLNELIDILVSKYGGHDYCAQKITDDHIHALIAEKESQND